jgi:hypothetical protein
MENVELGMRNVRESLVENCHPEPVERVQNYRSFVLLMRNVKMRCREYFPNYSFIFFLVVLLFLTNCKVNVTDNSIPLLKLFIDLVGNKTVAMPTFTPPAGNYTDTQNVKISTTTLDAIIRYTTDGTEPNCITSAVYSNTVTVIYPTTIKAIGCKDGYSPITTNAMYTLPTVYASGGITNRAGVNVGGYWKNGTWVALSIPNATKDISLRSFILSGNDVYAAGTYNSSPDSSILDVPGYWKNENWTALSKLDATKYSYVHSIVLSGLDVYVSGTNQNSSGILVAGYWKNEIWNALPSIDNSKDSYATSLIISGIDIYIGGYSKNSSGIAVPVYWKNGTRILLTTIDNTDVSVNSIFVSGNDVYATGGNSLIFMNYTSVHTGYWKNGIWTNLPSPDSSKISSVSFITGYASDIYAIGMPPSGYNVVTIPVTGYWKNGAWTALSQLDATKSSQALKLVISGTDLYVAGYSTNSSGARIAGFWRNGNWIPLSDGTNDSAAFDIVVVP